jgi:ribulose-bisphosphate carboxylase large chain
MFPEPGPGYQIMPVFSSGQSAKQAGDTYRLLGSSDLIFACGGGIMAHPGGIAAGVRSVRAAWEAAMSGVSLAEAAAAGVELRQALEKFGE